jgi:hypothetical protein
MKMIAESLDLFESAFIQLPASYSPLPFINLQWFADDNDEDAPGKT